jgi:transposase
VIHAFNQRGLDVLDPRWAGGRPRRIHPDEERFIDQTARTRPEKLGCPFIHWSTRKLQAYLRWRNANARHPEVLAAQTP